MADEQKTTRNAVIVTGASTGIGKTCALHLDRLGFHVFGGGREDKDGESLIQRSAGRVTAAWNDFERVENKLTVVTGGTGFRYEIARAYGLHMGVDLAFSPDVTAIYVQFGSAWLRP